MRPRKAPELLTVDAPTMCAHHWVGMDRSATAWLRLEPGPLWFCETCHAYTRSTDLVQASDQWVTA